mmetsp:Transcript_15435/g.27732  ORF Transcript_15435/g.27732 Transcript_15435/m.27732 type:complete len:351 (-) Transcript_15435:200-1252(-)|eukprot:CAMPEP_0197516916 /NCGR_PEP_ID=MMETSP1318-20131121/1872_1 /TAXON_ID=552666 /ORGANISM="Partenskyella glossopodia, Strain RCC365" /LENGTH=350 /DNA_ID=CAMNT_0043066061 /DNA_START=58 /DNA_END=1110 /DNA_ORIENTATION=+
MRGVFGSKGFSGPLTSRLGLLIRRCDIAVILVPVALMQLIFLYLEFYGGVPPGGFKACRHTPCVQKIPKIIHQTYKTQDVPPNWAKTPGAWKEKHPDWEYMFWTDEKNRKLIEEHYNWFLGTYDGYPYGIQRSDAARYFILNHYGGVYADLDIQPLRSVTEIIGDAELVLPQTPNFGLTNAFMASTKGNPFMKYVTEILPNHANRWYQVVRHWHIMTSAGPTFLWAQYEGWTGDKSNTLIVPAGYWGKCSICKAHCRDLSTSPLHHLTGNSWFAIDSFIFNYVIMCNPLPLAVCILFLVDLYRSGRLTFQKMNKHVAEKAFSKSNNTTFAAKWALFFVLAGVVYYLKQMP